MSLCEHCISGVQHAGTPTGQVETIGGVPVYVARGNGDPTKALLIFPDVFGLALVNNKLLADDFGNRGLSTYVIDYYQGDPVPDAAMGREGAPGKIEFNLGAWLGKHPISEVVDQIRSVVTGLRAQGVKSFAVSGYCFGAKPIISLAQELALKAVVLNHPSLLEFPTDLETLKNSNVPALFNTCETDWQYPRERQLEGDHIFADGKMEREGKYLRRYWPGVVHGFAVRAEQDLGTAASKAREESFEAAVHWVKKFIMDA